jgi:putative secretion ATPase (PEP-CTERM system associated)
MYTSFYKLRGKPFSLTPDPKFFYGSKGHRRAFSYLEYGVLQEEGFLVITGEVGAGKTTLVRNLFNKLDTTAVVGAQLVSTQLDTDDTLRMVAASFGLPQEGCKAVLLKRLEAFLMACREQRKRALLVVDEVQNLPADALEELRMLSNYQVGDRSLLQTFLVGQPEFRLTIQSPRMTQLRQRVIAAFHLGPLDVRDTHGYIEHRLQTVGWQGDPSFNKEAIGEIFSFTGGIPRRINALCDRLMLLGSMEEKHAFGKHDVREVIGDVQSETSFPGGAGVAAGAVERC